MKLSSVCKNNMIKHIVKPLSQTHSRYFLDLLNKYDDKLQNYFYYAAISYNTVSLMVGTEYDYEYIVDADGLGPKGLFDFLISPNGERYQDLKDIYYLSNKDKYDVLYIPTFVNEKMLCFVCVKDKENFLNYMKISHGSQIYDKYPVLCAILNWGITYIISDMQEDKIQDIFLTDIKQSENYIKVCSSIVDHIMREKWLPYASTLHAIAGWNYENQANYGYIDFIEPMKHCDELLVKFRNPLLFSAHNARTIRKYVELSNEELRIKSESSKGFIIGETIPEDSYWSFVGLGMPQLENVTSVRFEGKSSWRMLFENESIYYNGSSYILKRIKKEKADYVLATQSFYHEREIVTNEYDFQTVDIINSIIEMASLQSHGTMVVFSPNAREEAARLCKCGRGIAVKEIDFYELMKNDNDKARKIMFNLTKIDGAILFDEKGICYSIGTIVDGRAHENSNPGRGARYNSGYTYVHDCNERDIQCYCAVISEDNTIDIFGMFGKTICEKIKEKDKLNRIE